MPRQAGSILVEVLLTVVIMSVSLTILIGGLLSGYRMTLLNGDYSQALLILDNRLARLRYDEFKRLSSSSARLASGKTFSLELHTQTAPIAKNERLKALDCLLSWPSGKKTMRLPVSTYFLSNEKGLP